MRRKNGRILWAFGALLVGLTSCLSTAWAIMPDDPGPGDVLFSINSSSNVKPISPYIYGTNAYVSSVTNAGMTRLGGNRWTGYNWETNASNAGRDWYYHSDNYLGSGAPGNAVLPTLQNANAGDYATVVTVPMAGYVAADTNGTIDESDKAPSLARLNIVAAKKQTIYPGSPLSLSPNLGDDYVFTDEFVNWVETARQNNQTVFYSLDNEPALWGEDLPPGWDSGTEPNPCCNPANGVDPGPGGRTHAIIHPYDPTFAEMRSRTIDHASAIKDVNPNALVFGGVGYGWEEFRNLQGAPDFTSSPSHPGGDGGLTQLHYYEWLLNELAQEEANQGRTLMDVLDLHWYPEAQGTAGRITNNNNSPGQVAARVQATRSLWDPTYTEVSWITDCCSGGPIQLLNRIQRDIDDFKPGTKIAITEYNYGGSNHISGAIAQADFLGVMGEYNVFAASWWALESEGNSQFALAAFDMFRNFDGSGATFGNMSVAADTDSIADSAIYASIDANNPERMVVVAINRTNQPLDTAIAVTSEYRFDSADVFQLTGASANPVAAGSIPIDLVNAFHYEMPAYSVSTLVLNAVIESADFNVDDNIDGMDFLIWQRNSGTSSGASRSQGDANGDGAVNAADLGIWEQQYGTASLAAAQQVPEPATCLLLLTLMLFVSRNLVVSHVRGIS